ncbi:polymorphic outer membrane protein middle domain-containing protein [Chlamydia pneumoniae]|uniref:Probable outer membrane protein pmp18 n=1 Tax=Chlamydia pneumoniae TaxID=83558 RepID=A0A0F7WJ74_CHLPN|nr:polymorphic outer membrane protein middle domain-containing protein [Chlamydia pneumoniae]AAD18610.1 Polymorphic Outer Membrane Protein E/F Family [Chlamydia pneumoniae CWL029]CRI32980.1 Probable outer membrane protein pmp18 [Chlamydia pneumoniae]CRI36970.1 Probable outer membrane protein pmp18 [Chlamydia pneumoniae]CRI38095.1 Probable outer membrane protein pmp18 [Chlamydia pneumoniae]CRI39228.1 Probable outer membrane protein pmp18 [Chlamydia pneumoniae]
MQNNRSLSKSSFFVGALILGKTTILLNATPLSDYFDNQANQLTTLFPLIDTLTNMTPYSHRATLFGVRDDTNQDIVLDHQNSIESWFENFSQDGGALSCKSLAITNTKNQILFLNSFAIKRAGAMYVNGNFDLSENHGSIIFSGNLSFPNASNFADTCTGGAVLCSKNVTISKNQGTAYFINNKAKSSGGAIQAAIINIKDNTGPCLFFNNAAGGTAGGALFANACRIENNSQPIYFLNNQSGLGGAIRVHQECILTKNTGSVIFNNNFAMEADISANHSSGGAIYCISCSIKDNPGIAAFDNNTAARDGGAICTQSLTIQDSGPVYFTNNQGTWGGAIMLRQDGACTLFADQGDIIFYNNRHFKDTFSNHVSVNCTRNVSLTVGASQGHSATFYDPILQRYTIQNSIQKFNPNPEHLGTILFSSTYIPDTSTSRDDFISHFRNHIGLYNGTLALEDRAEWKVYKFDQFGGTLRLGSRAVFSTTDEEQSSSSVGSVININNLAINLPSILGNRVAPKLWIRPTGSSAPYSEDNNPIINLSGPLSLLDDENLDPYDTADLAQPIAEVPLLYLLDVTAKHINTDNFYPEGLNTTQHYGYQGVWSPYWIETITTSDTSSEDTVNTLHRQLYGDWTPTGYKVNPENKGDIALSAFWQSFHNLFATLRYQTQQGQIAPTASGEATRLFVHQNSNNDAKGFHMEATGYSLGTTSNTASNHSFGVNFSQLFSNLYESHSDNSVASHTTTVALQINNPWLQERFSTSASLAYSYSNHHIKASGYSGKIQTEGKCYSTTLGAALSCSLSLQWRSRPLHFTPFIQAIAVRSNQTAFQESGDKARKFSVHKPLYNLTVPLGIQSAWESKFRLPTYWNIELAYQPVLYQQNPEINVSLESSGSSWLLSGTTLARNAIAFKGRNQIFIFPKLSVFLDYQGSVSSSTTTHYLHAGTTFKF